ncbi:adenylate kinase [Trypanosoma grayi]|uniref:adenylate kinase n=1 Tax=Trypanosoma grayi TaxID=71804 RepID=UPI0004F45506|nr:adenylate kinase [Trypanosoma grayi]KEG08469.1 adenylate kinase [Trypanosoma grayi]
MPLNLLLFGAPGCGKGSAGEALVKDYSLLHISAGSLMRDEVEKGTKIGRQVAAYMSEGRLIPDEVIVKVMAERLSERDARAKGVLLDGYPRTLSQAKALAATGFEIDAMVFISVDAQMLEERCLLRRLDPVTGRIYNLKSDPPPDEIMSRLLIRSDDTREKHQRRMKIYRAERTALLEYYAGRILEVDGNPPFPVVYASMRVKIDALARAKRKSKL